MNVGTPEFMAPEMVASQKGNGSYDEKVDVWSIGMVLFELLTLDVPYRLNGLSRFELLDAVASGVRPTVDAALQKKVALRKLWKLWNKLTEFDAERRLSAAAAAKRVHKVLKTVACTIVNKNAVIIVGDSVSSNSIGILAAQNGTNGFGGNRRVCHCHANRA
jgi:serine/threonine protein kinase